jgi:hypothetical protein
VRSKDAPMFGLGALSARGALPVGPLMVSPAGSPQPIPIMKTTLSPRLGLAVALALLTLPGFGNVTVTTVTDENNGSLDPGLGSGTSLREAVAHATAGSVIDFAPALSGQTVLLTAGQISFSKNLTLDASALAAGVTVSGNNTTRLFDIPSSRVVAMSRLKMVHGHTSGDGGGIRNAGSLSLTDCEFSGNHAADGGGAIWNSGALTLTACTLEGNQADVGGGAIEQTANVLTMINCTLTGNTAEFGGAVDGDGSSTIHLRSCTISANHASNDGGGLEETTGTLLLENTIIAANTASDQGPDLKASGINTQAGVNLISNVAGLGGAFSGIVAPPQLSALGSHGGPTRTMPPLAGSPAINAGGTTTLTVDQRGLPRLVGGVTDIGAVEVQTANLVTVTADAGPGSLRQVVQDAPAGAAITFDPPLDGSTITLTSPIVLTKNLTLDAAAREELAVAGGDAVQLLIVNAGVSATMVGLELRDGVCASGGAIRNSGQLALVDCAVSSCHAWNGGALSNAAGAVLTLTDCELAGNVASDDGGGLHNQGTATLTRVAVTGNVAGEDGGSGGAVYSTGSLSVTDSVVTGNDAQTAGGIRSSGTVTLTRVSVTGNRAWDGSGGGIVVTGNGGTIEASTLYGNSCLGSGGGVYHGGGDLTITRSTLAGNTSDYEWGGAFAAFAPGPDDLLDVISCTLSGNEAGEEGGGIHVEPGSRLRLDNSIVAGNSAFTAGPDLRGAIETQAGVNLVSSTDGIDGGFTGIVAPPQLGPLADNGGATWTMLPLVGSPVIDAGGTTSLTVDQRGLPRVAGAGTDIGAVEWQETDLDTEPPTRPLDLTLSAKSASSLSLVWEASTDETSLAGYDVYLDGVLAGSPASNVFTVLGLVGDRSYTLRVRARDFAGNLSPPSNALLATPQSGGLQSPPEPVRTHFRAIVLNYNPRILVNGQLVPADTYYGNRNVDDLVADYIETMRKASGGQMNWTVTGRFELDEWAPPEGTPTELYTPENALELAADRYEYDVSYHELVQDPRFDIDGRTNAGELDAVWVFGAYGVRFSETALVGPGPFFSINGRIEPDASLDSNLVFYGFGKEARQSVGFMFENTSHMAEVIMGDRLQPAWPLSISTHTFNTLNFVDPSRALVPRLVPEWTYFTQAEASSWDYRLVAPGRAQCGLSHYPPTALYNYNWNTFRHEFDGTAPFVPIDGTWSISAGEYHVAAGNGVKSLAFDDELHEPSAVFHPVQAFLRCRRGILRAGDEWRDLIARGFPVPGLQGRGRSQPGAGLLPRFECQPGSGRARQAGQCLHPAGERPLRGGCGDQLPVPPGSARQPAPGLFRQQPDAADFHHRYPLHDRRIRLLHLRDGSLFRQARHCHPCREQGGQVVWVSRSGSGSTRSHPAGMGRRHVRCHGWLLRLVVGTHPEERRRPLRGRPDERPIEADAEPLVALYFRPQPLRRHATLSRHRLPSGRCQSPFAAGRGANVGTGQPPKSPWIGKPSDDDVGVTRYAVFRDGQFLRKTARSHLHRQAARARQHPHL